MYGPEDIRTLHVELTTHCNASCPMCLRNVLGGRVNPRLPLAELTLQDVRAILPAAFLARVRKIYLCGNYGDALVARDTIEVLEYFREASRSARLGMYTNGSGRTAAWWARLAGVLDYCRFGIDGLEDTNALHRRGTRWETVLDSVRAFVAAGGRAEWDFIVFRHNEHQVERARRLAEELGVASFNVTRTYRFLSPRTGRVMRSLPVLDRDGGVVGRLEPPLAPEYQNDGLRRFDDLSRAPGGRAAYLDTTAIRCKAVAARSLYLSAEGLILPCCWLGNLYRWHERPDPEHDLLARIPGGRAALDGREHDVADIVRGEVFQRFIPESWARPSVAQGRLEMCARTCGEQDVYQAQFTEARS